MNSIETMKQKSFETERNPGEALQAWASAFIQSAETGFNQHDLDATVAAYASAAQLEFITESISDTAKGKCEIKDAWAAIFKAMPHFRLKKKIIAFNASTICNEWEGTISKRGKRKAVGMEYWEFDPEGKVVYHRLFTFLKVAEIASPMAKLSFGLKFPLIGLKIEKARKKFKNKLKSQEVSCRC